MTQRTTRQRTNRHYRCGNKFIDNYHELWYYIGMKDPRYKKDSLVQAWIDRRNLATIINSMHRKGENPLNLSNILRLAIDHWVKKIILEKDGVKYVTFTEDADLIIDSSLEVKLNRGGKGLQNLRDNLTLDKLRQARIDEIDRRSEVAAQAEAKADIPDIDPRADLLKEKAQLLVTAKMAPNLEAAMNMIREHEKSISDAEKMKEAREAIDSTEKVV